MAQDPWAAFQDVAVIDNPPRGVAPDAGGGRPLTLRGGTPAPALTPASGSDPWAGFQDVQVHDAPGGQGSSWWDTAKDVAQSAATGIEKGAIGLATMPAAIDHFGRNTIGAVADHFLPAPSKPAAQQPPDLSDYLSVQGAERGAAAIGQPFYHPQTRAGRYAETVGEFLPGATGGGFLSALRYGVAPAIASEAAGEATQGTRLEPYARAGAALATGGAAALASRPGTAAGALSDAAGGLDRSTLDAAQRLMDVAQQQGTPLTLAEAVQHVTDGGTRLGSLQRVVEQSRGGAEAMGRFYAGRPDQVQDAGGAAIDRIGTVPAVPLDGSMGPVYPNTSAIGPGVQRAAQGALDATQLAQDARAALSTAGPRVGAEQAGQAIQGDLRSTYDARLAARLAQARSDYAAAGSDTINPDGVQAILDDLDRQATADKTGLLAPRLRDLRKRLSVPAKPQGPQWEADPLGSGILPDAPDMPSPPASSYMDRPEVAPRPDVPRPQTLHQFVRAAGGVRDPGGDLKAMGLDQVPGLVVGPGKGFNPDQMRQAAAQAGFLGPNIDEAMANTTIGDLHDALAAERPVHSVYDSAALDVWNAHDLSRAEAGELRGSTGRSAMPGRPPMSAYGDELGAAAPAEPSRVPITDIANLDRARKVYNDRIALPVTAPGAIEKETVATLGPVLDRLGNVMEEGSPAFARAKSNFRQNSIPLQPFEQIPGIVRSIEQDRYGSRFMTPADQVPGAILGGGPSSARAFNSVATDPARQAMENHFTTTLLDQATGPTGLVDADRLAKVVRDNGDTLRQFPAVHARMQRVIDTQQALAPLGNTMAGRLAATPQFREQAAILLSPNPVPGSAREVGEAVRQVAEQSPAAARALVSQHIWQTFAETTQANVGGPNQWAGPKFAAAIRGNSEQAKNLRAAVEALHGPQAWQDFSKVLDVFEAMGRRQAPGSQTEFNRQLSTELQKGGKVGELAAAAASPAKWLGKAQELYDGWRYGRNTASLAEMLTAPDAAKRLTAIAKAPKGSAQSNGMAAAYLLQAAGNQARERVPK